MDVIRKLLASLAGVTEKRSRFGGGDAFFRGGREFAHFHSATECRDNATGRNHARRNGAGMT